MSRGYYRHPPKAQNGRNCHQCVWRHNSGDYLCDFATLAAPMTRGGVPAEECRHFVKGRRIQNGKALQKALKKLGLG